MIKADSYYVVNLHKIVNEGSWDQNPTPSYEDGVKAYSKFISQVFETYDISKDEFPMTTLRNTAVKTGISEILWIYQDQSSALDKAHDRNITWWDNWSIGDGSIGQRYGATVKRYNLINNLLKNLKTDPFSRRHVMNLWQEHDLNENAGLSPCVYETIWTVVQKSGELYLNMTLIQRSNDYIVAGYINKMQYVALMMMIANHCKYKYGIFCHYVQNLHLYDRHFNAVDEILNKTPLTLQPKMTLTSTDFYNVKLSDFNIFNTDYITKINSPVELAI